MARPATRGELLTRIDSEFADLLAAIDLLGPGIEASGVCGEWSAKDLLAHLDEWHELFLTWEAAGRTGVVPPMPAPGYSWKDTPALNDELWRRRRDDPPAEVLSRLRASHARVRDVVSAYGDDELFAKRRWPWTGSTSVGSYAVSATTSHYEWAAKLVRKACRRTPPRP